MYNFRPGCFCLNGHCVCHDVVAFPHAADKFCAECGEPVISTCPQCGAAIRGSHLSEGSYINQRRFPPAHCPACGARYPWTDRRIEALRNVIVADPEVPVDLKDKAVASLPHVLCDTPFTRVAASVWHRVLHACSEITRETLSSIIAEIACQLFLRLIDLQ